MSPTKPLTLNALRKEMRRLADPTQAKLLARFFRTGTGQYGEGDKFLGVMVPQTRAVVRKYRDLPLKDVERLLRSPWHEERLAALLLLVHQYQTATEKEQQAIVRFYLRSVKLVNNWDLVDQSAPRILGTHLLKRPRLVLHCLARSGNLWERRIAIVSTLAFIVEGQFTDTLRISDTLIHDSHDLIHKAMGWMLREVGKRDLQTLKRYLKSRAPRLPRTTLRYAIERFPEAERKRYLAL